MTKGRREMNFTTMRISTRALALAVSVYIYISMCVCEVTHSCPGSFRLNSCRFSICWPQRPPQSLLYSPDTHAWRPCTHTHTQSHTTQSCRVARLRSSGRDLLRKFLRHTPYKQEVTEAQFPEILFTLIRLQSMQIRRSHAHQRSRAPMCERAARVRAGL